MSCYCILLLFLICIISVETAFSNVDFTITVAVRSVLRFLSIYAHSNGSSVQVKTTKFTPWGNITTGYDTQDYKILSTPHHRSL